MRSDIIHVTGEPSATAAALDHTERVAEYKSLSAKDAMHLRLLTEEMMGIMRALTGEKEADFFIEDEDGVFSLHLIAKASVDSDMRKRLLSISSSGKNAAAKGVTGKLRDLFERFAAPGDISIGSDVVSGLYCIGMGPDLDAVTFNADTYWSLQKYRESLKKGDENWDELESSVVACLADDVRVGIVGQNVELTIIKKL